MNLTICVPNGTTNHGNPQLLCFPSSWTDIVTFLVTNYYAHAATVLVDPGMGSRRLVVAVFAALILPFSGISRAVFAICRHAITERKNPLKRAARARALCMMMKAPRSGPYLGALRAVRRWGKPMEEVAIEKPEISVHPEILSALDIEETPCSVEMCNVDSTKQVSFLLILAYGQLDGPSRTCWWEVAKGYEPLPRHCTFSGKYWLDEEYYLAFVPYHADLAFAQPSKGSSTDGLQINSQDVTIPNSYSVIQSFVGIAQGLWAILTIYQARGDQIQEYGYAAFGLTVVPYAFMSVVNAVANLLTPQYASISVIRTPAMTEAEQRGKANFKAALDVDLLTVPASTVPWEWTPVIQEFLPLLLGLVPVAIIGALSKFQAGNSTPLQRGFTMSWLAVGIVYGCVIHTGTGDPGDPVEEAEKNQNKGKKKMKKDRKKKHRSIKQYLMDDAACENSAPDMGMLFFTLCISPPAIVGMVLVGLMIKEYGNCSLLG